ncbi:HpcH/HpaI aldolase family protein [Trujillonella endophytica]|uniref:4-hydroxy-2-oxoheptanedioate aldolase n=1 Tax=Trujillonella endophytica TaxID=673521 RepID=A0A1H8SWJ6_9ACTN|nr:aldolase/citrate lyase family protein [Trujillella endophytica]SEO82563.1 4-hydroxy-2-oxoheptanedioate aldolase [Trujillella endophytica]
MNPIRAKVDSGSPAVGAWVLSPSGLAAEVFGSTGFDFLILDAQHGGITWDNMLAVLQGLGASTSTPLVRVGWNDPTSIMRALDLGAAGVIVPMVSTAEEAARAAGATRYPLDGYRSFGPVRKPSSPAQANENVLCLPMIETAEGLANLEEIVATPGVDGIFVGPVDMALALGHTAIDYSAVHPAALEALDEVIRVCHAHGKLAGSVTLGATGVADLLGRGVDFLTVGSDNAYLRQGARRDLDTVAAWLASNDRSEG